ncbi:MAG: DUF433 domain-containing protein [Chloroflexota bacterium]
MQKFLNGMPKLVTEQVGNELYQYYPLGIYVVRAPAICGGRPTFKYTRIDVDFILDQLAFGKSIQFLVDDYNDPHLTADAIKEAMFLTKAAFNASPLVITKLAA